MFNESQVNSVHTDIHLREKNDIQIQENNGMKQSEKDETEEIEPKKNEFEKKDYQLTDRKRKRSHSDNNN